MSPLHYRVKALEKWREHVEDWQSRADMTSNSDSHAIRDLANKLDHAAEKIAFVQSVIIKVAGIVLTAVLLAILGMVLVNGKVG